MNFNIVIVEMLIPLLVLAAFCVKYLNLFEDPETEKEMYISIGNIGRTREERRNVGKRKFKSAKIIYPIFIVAFSLSYIVIFISRMIEKSSSGLIVYNELTFVLGILLFIAMLIMLVIGIIKKERIYASENVRKYAYIYLNIFVSLLLIVK